MTSSSIQATPQVLTAAGRRDVQQRLDRALEALTKLAQRMSAGERSADELAEHQRLLAQVEQLTAVLSQASTVDAVDEDPTIVEVGDEVDVEDEDGSVDTYALVHSAEANAGAGRVSVDSPLGRALLGARPGDRVVVQAPDGPYTCTVRDRRRLQ
jgi:transcription elongation GreA/GreB family factor